MDMKTRIYFFVLSIVNFLKTRHLMNDTGGDMIMSILEILLGLAILPVLAYFIATTVANASVISIPGATIVIPIIGLAVAFGLVYKGVKDAKEG